MLTSSNIQMAVYTIIKSYLFIFIWPDFTFCEHSTYIPYLIRCGLKLQSDIIVIIAYVVARYAI